MNLNYEFVPCKHDDKKGWRKTQLLMSNKESIKVHEALYEYFYTAFFSCREDWQLVLSLEAALQRCSYQKMFWKYVTKLQENTNAEV